MIQDQQGLDGQVKLEEIFLGWDLNPVCLQNYDMDRVGAQLNPLFIRGWVKFSKFSKKEAISEFSQKRGVGKIRGKEVDKQWVSLTNSK